MPDKIIVKVARPEGPTRVPCAGACGRTVLWVEGNTVSHQDRCGAITRLVLVAAEDQESESERS